MALKCALNLSQQHHPVLHTKVGSERGSKPREWTHTNTQKEAHTVVKGNSLSVCARAVFRESNLGIREEV